MHLHKLLWLKFDGARKVYYAAFFPGGFWAWGNLWAQATGSLGCIVAGGAMDRRRRQLAQTAGERLDRLIQVGKRSADAQDESSRVPEVRRVVVQMLVRALQVMEEWPLDLLSLMLYFHFNMDLICQLRMPLFHDLAVTATSEVGLVDDDVGNGSGVTLPRCHDRSGWWCAATSWSTSAVISPNRLHPLVMAL